MNRVSWLSAFSCAVLTAAVLSGSCGDDTHALGPADAAAGRGGQGGIAVLVPDSGTDVAATGAGGATGGTSGGLGGTTGAGGSAGAGGTPGDAGGTAGRDGGAADRDGGAAGRDGGAPDAVTPPPRCVAGAACAAGYACQQMCRLNGRAAAIACFCAPNGLVACEVCAAIPTPICPATVINGQRCMVAATNPPCNTTCENGVNARCTCMAGGGGGGGGGGAATWRCVQNAMVCM